MGIVIPSLLLFFSVDAHNDEATGVFDWPDLRNLIAAIVCGLVAGVLGHNCVSMSLKHIPAYCTSLMQLTQPIIGQTVGYFMGAAGIPGPVTCLGGIVLLLAMGVAT